MQARAMKAQARYQRDVMRMQMRADRRRSLVGPVILLALGVMFLLAELGRVPWGESLEWYSRWWPAVLIAAGLLLLAEWSIDQRRSASQGQGQGRVLGGGVVFLLILLTLFGLSTRTMEGVLHWHDRTFGPGDTQFDHLFGEQHDADSALTSAIDSDAVLVVHNPHGDITVTGASPDGQVHVSVHTQTYAWKAADAQAKARRLQPVFTHAGKDLELDVASVEGGQADLTIELPRPSAITLSADHGNVDVSDLGAAVSISANHGDIEVSGVDGSVTLHVNDDDANLTLHSISGSVLIDGHGGDTEISDVKGDISMQGDFFGSTHVEHVGGAMRFDSSRTHFSAARLDEEFSISRDSLDASQLLGPVVLKAADKNITLDRVAGSVDITNRNGSVSVTHAPPAGSISIVSSHGSVDLGLSENTGFQLNAQTRNGAIENDFGLTEMGADRTHTLSGKVAGGGPAITITTTDGDITVRRSSVAALPTAPPTVAAPPAPPSPPAPRTEAKAATHIGGITF
jgi:hypothetical protein